MDNQVKRKSVEYPLVSIIVVNTNEKRYIGRCLSSLLNQTYPNLEIIVVDNASTDGSVEYIKKNFPEVKIVESKINAGCPGGRNIGIKNAKGKYLAFIDADAMADRKWIENLVKVAKSNDKIGMCASKILYYQNPKVINSTGTLICKDLTAINRGIGEDDINQYEEIEEVFGFHGAAHLLKKEMLDQIGLYDADYFMQHEEVDLSLRGRIAGWKCYYVPQAIVYHERSASIGIGAIEKLYYGERNKIQTILKLLPMRFIMRALFYSIKKYYYMYQIRAKRKADDSIVRKHSVLKLLMTLCRAWFDAFIAMPKIIKKRKKINCHRIISEREFKKMLRRFESDLYKIKGLWKAPTVNG